MNVVLQILLTFFILVQVVVAFYLLQPTLLWVLYGFKRLLVRRPVVPESRPDSRQYSFAAIITAHKNLELVPPLVDSLMKQTYRNFKVYIVADACEQTLHYDDPEVVFLKPEKDLNAKIMSIDYAIEHFEDAHDVLIIFDADNLAHPDYLQVLNNYFNRGYKAVQTNMQAKNNDTVYARLDAAGNLYNNFVDRRVRMELGLSANIWGLGIAITTELYKQVVYQHFLGGFDKKIQADIVKRIPLLAYAEDAIVYDEKIEDGTALETQRTRWINAYFKYFKCSVDVLWTGIRRFNFNLFYFGINLLRPPLFLQLGAALLFALANIFISISWAVFWVGAVALFAISFFGIVLMMANDPRMFSTLLHVPMVVLRQASAFLKIRRANKSFLQTQNNRVMYIEDVLNR